MLRIYDYIFYKTYQILEIFDTSSSFAAIIILCWMFLFNSFTVVDCVIRNSILSAFFDRTITVMYTIFLVLIHSGYFYYKRRDLRLISKFENESNRSSIIGLIGVLSYFFLTILIFFKYALPCMGGITA